MAVQTSIAPPPVKPTPATSDEFGNFGSAPSQVRSFEWRMLYHLFPEPCVQAGNLGFMDELVGLPADSSPLSLDNLASPMSALSANEHAAAPVSNDFSDFSSNIVVSSDDFGDFSSADNASEPVTFATSVVPTYTLNVVPPSPSPSSASSSSSPTSFVPTLTPVEDSMDDFGDFSSLSPAPAQSTHDALETGQTATLQLPRTSHVESEFGDLATPSPLTDDFGDFGSATIASPPKNVATSSSDVEEEFGNFGSNDDSLKSFSAPVAPGSVAVSSLDDIFNDILGERYFF